MARQVACGDFFLLQPESFHIGDVDGATVKHIELERSRRFCPISSGAGDRCEEKHRHE
jgi:hypothetical protein